MKIMKPYFLLLLGNFRALDVMLAAFGEAGLTLILPPEGALPATLAADAALQILDPKSPPKPLPDLFWVAWNRSDDPALTLGAYQAGARAVFPPETPPEVIAQSIRRTIDEAQQAHIAPHEAIRRHYQRGDLILLEADAVLQVESGVLATTMIHQDGAAVLLGLSGPGQLLIAHPADNCHIEIVAHTDTLVAIQAWETAAHQPDFTKKLRARLQQMEGWAAMQARPYLDQQILGILGLLAVQFGRACAEGMMIDVRITHAQLASAVGANRTSISRVLGELRLAGKLISTGKAENERFCLPEGVPKGHY